MNPFQRSAFRRPTAMIRTTSSRMPAGRAPQPMVRGPRRAARPWYMHGADEGLLGSFTSPDMLYGILPMALVVGAGFWMATH
jgi:hypothetical protein